MIPYLVVLILAVVITHLGRRYCSKASERLILLFVGLLLVFFAGFRSRSVGTDTGTYIAMLESVTSLEEALTYHVELGYSLLILASSSLSSGYAVMLTMIAMIVVFSYLFTLVRFTERYETALFLFITLGSYTFFFNGARQGIAAAICFLALPLLLERKALYYFLLIGLATFFHKTALLAIPLYFLARSRVGWRELLFVLVGAGVMAFFLSIFAQLAAGLIDERYASYGQEGEGGGHVKVAFLFGQGVIFLLLRKDVSDPKGYYAKLLSIYLIGLVPAIASVIGSVNPSGILRLSAYFEHTAILLWPMVFISFKNEWTRAIISIAFLLVAVAYFILTTTGFSDLTPYRINPGLIS